MSDTWCIGVLLSLCRNILFDSFTHLLLHDSQCPLVMVVVVILHCNAACWYNWRIYNSCILLIAHRESLLVYI